MKFFILTIYTHHSELGIRNSELMNITIIGLGLLGGSFGLAIRQAQAANRVIGIDLNQEIIDRACERGAIDEGHLDSVEAVREADLVVLAMPVRTIIDTVSALADCLSEKTILFDLGSTKAAISRKIAALPIAVRYIGGHPMAGTEQAGIDAAAAGLFSGAPFALVPPAPVDDEAVELLSCLIRAIGAYPIIIPADRHDQIVAMTSHLPYLLSAALVQTAEKTAQTEHRLWDFVAGGFRDTSRVAASNVRVMTDICLTNQKPILKGIEQTQQALAQMAVWIKEGDQQALEAALTQSKATRTRVFGERGTTLATKKVSFQGERGAFSEIAALEYFGDAAEPIPQPWFDDAFKAVELGHCDYGILPIENSLAGSIHINYDLMLQHNLHIVGEIKLRIVHNLLVTPGVSKTEILQVQSHPKALEQCVEFFRDNPELKSETVYDTGGAAKMLSESGARDIGVIASTRAAEHYGLEILESGVEDNPQNYTRFLVLAPEPAEPEGDRIKTTIVFSVPHESGTLFKVMSAFALRDISINKIESRPLIGSPWEYFFYLDFEGKANSLQNSRALNHLQEITTYYKLLGSYEEGRTVDRG